MESLTSTFIPTDYGQIHVIHSDLKALKMPLVFIPGMLGKAQDWVNDLESFEGHPSVAISLRGRGQSDAPDSGFSVFDHADDIKKVIEFLGFQRVILIGSSQGALYATAYAIRNSRKVAGLVIQDKVLKQKRFGREWVEKAKQHPAELSESLLWNIANDSLDLNLLNESSNLSDLPALLIKGGNSAMVMEEDLIEMKQVLTKTKVKVFPESGHDVSSPDYDLYVKTLGKFFDSIPTAH